MTDKNNAALAKGDLILVRFDTFLDINDMKVIYHSVDSAGYLIYYPINTIGLSLAKYQAGEAQSGFFRKEEFKLNDIQSNQITLLDPGHLNPSDFNLYNKIIAIL
jgi:hypothetical protein